ncbi:hypothetical protein CEQ90_05895 [Lewinellaceae bacterium SD302]|nr:hypothetical protein CEQ90_05895 [Lewinellaceae bacterium SD302]
MLKKIIILFSWLVLGPIPGAGQLGSIISAVERAEIAMETDPGRAKAICDSLNALPLTDLESAYVNFTLSDAYYYLEDIRGSSRAAAEALRVMPDSFPLAKQITLYNSQGQNLDILGKMDSAIWHYQRGIAIASRINDSLELSDLYFNLGTAYNKQLAYNQALTYLDSSYQIDLMLEDSSKLSNLLRYIGFLQMRYYDYGAAKSQLIKALNFANSDDPSQSCVVLTTLGTLHEQLGEIDSLRHYLELARDCYTGIEDHTTIHYLYKLEGEYYLLAGDTLNAINSFDISSRIAGQIGDETGRIMTNLQSLELRNDTN